MVVSLAPPILGALVNLGGTGRYIHWGFIQISVANFVVICLMVVVFVAAILVPFRHRLRPVELRQREDATPPADRPDQ